MLVDEFLKQNAHTEMLETMVSSSPDEKPKRSSFVQTGRASPKRVAPNIPGSSSPKAKTGSPRRFTETKKWCF